MNGAIEHFRSCALLVKGCLDEKGALNKSEFFKVKIYM